MDELCVGDIVYIYWSATDKMEPVNYRGRIEEKAVVVKDGYQISILFTEIKQLKFSVKLQRNLWIGFGGQLTNIKSESKKYISKIKAQRGLIIFRSKLKKKFNNAIIEDNFE